MAQVGVLDLLHSTDIFRFNFQSPASMQPNPNNKCNDPTMDGDYLTATQPTEGEPSNTTLSLNSNFRLESYVLPMALLLPSTSSSPIPHPRPCSSGTKLKFLPYPPPDCQPGGPAQPSAHHLCIRTNLCNLRSVMRLWIVWSSRVFSRRESSWTP